MLTKEEIRKKLNGSMSKAEMKKLFKTRWNELFPGKRLLAVQLNGFTHTIYYDERSPRAKVLRGGCHVMEYSSCISQGEAQTYGMNDNNVVKFFAGFPNFSYQNNPVEIVYVDPTK